MRIHTVQTALCGWPAERVPTTEQLTAYLDQVVWDMNQALKPTNRRVAAVRTVDLLPADWSPRGAVAVRDDFDVRLVLKYDPNYVGHGWAAFDADGSGCSIMSCYSLALHDLPARDRGQLLHTHLHEFLHLVGCAIGEMYDFHRHQDVTGTPPTLHLDSSDPNDRFWGAHRDWLEDPMVTNTGRTLCELNQAIVNGTWSMVNPPTVPTAVTIKCSGLSDDVGYVLELWRNDPDGSTPRQEMLIGSTVGGFALRQGVRVSLLKDGESWHTLTTLDLFLVKVRAPGVAFAAWFTVWDFLLSDEAVVHIDFRPDAAPQLPSGPLVGLFDAWAGKGEDGKPVFRFSAGPLQVGARYVVEKSTDFVSWASAAVFVADAMTMRFEFPHRDRQAAYRIRREESANE